MKSNYGLIGKKLGHSFSVPIHNMLGNNDYTLHELPPEEVGGFISARSFSGINVTIPYKQTVMPFLDEISERAQKIGSVNTVINRNGKLFGDNTDYYGFSYMARRAGISFDNKKVVILGGGGTSLTARTVAKDEGAKEIIIVDLGAENNYDNLYLHYDADIIINATPVGMYPNVDACLVDLNNFKQVQGVIDVIYNPIRTNILLQAKDKGIPYTNGLSMLVAQAKLAHELFFGINVNDSEIDRITRSLEAEKQNIIFIGMPGCGKTTLSTLTAQKLSKELIDTDDMIIESAGKPIPQIFEENGESHFRDLEAEAVSKASLLNGYIIATGGGVILRKENRYALQRNGLVIWLRYPVEKLATSGRPLSRDIETLREMEKQRYPLYEATADIAIDIDHCETDKNVERILELINIHKI